MKWAAEGARLPASERSPAIVRLPFMFVMLSTISVNRRGPLSMPCAELGIDGLKAGGRNWSRKSPRNEEGCIRQAGIGLGAGDRATGPPDTTFLTLPDCRY